MISCVFLRELMRMLLLIIILKVNEGALKKIEALVLQRFDIIFKFSPFMNLIILQNNAFDRERETSLIR